MKKNTTKDIRTYTELMKLNTFEERLEYLKLDGVVGEDTFGFDRWLNQRFYNSEEWKRIRSEVIVRDNGCDLGIPDHEIHSYKILIHHMNPITKNDILNRSDYLLNPEYLITTIKPTHDAIHYGHDIENQNVIERFPNDMCPWKR